jgi:hypothetical protein
VSEVVTSLIEQLRAHGLLDLTWINELGSQKAIEFMLNKQPVDQGTVMTQQLAQQVDQGTVMTQQLQQATQPLDEVEQDQFEESDQDHGEENDKVEETISTNILPAKKRWGNVNGTEARHITL